MEKNFPETRKLAPFTERGTLGRKVSAHPNTEHFKSQAAHRRINTYHKQAGWNYDINYKQELFYLKYCVSYTVRLLTKRFRGEKMLLYSNNQQ